MLDQHVARILLCGVCLTLFPSHADKLHGLDRYGNQTSDEVNGGFGDDDDSTFDNQLSLLDKNDYPTTRKNRSSFSNPVSIQPHKVRQGLQYTIDYLERNNLNKHVATRAQQISKLTNQDLADTVDALLNWNNALTPQAMKNDFYLIDLVRGKSGKSKFTGYYTPIVKAKLHADVEYRYPIYKKPKWNLRKSSRADITAGALAGKGYEVAWTNDPVGLFYVHIQGSGILEFPNGKRKSLKFDGQNDRRFESIAKHMKSRGLIGANPSRENIQDWFEQNPEQMDDVMSLNPRYIYFTLTDGLTRTSSTSPVIPGHTVAVDTAYIPFGSVILAEVPVINSKGKIDGQEWRILFPQDRGNAINGPARMDIYTGVGELARERANSLTGYGKAYLLLNKPQYNGGARASLDTPHIPAI